MALSETRPGPVTKMTNQRVDQRVHQQCTEQDQADDPSVQPQHLIIKQHEEHAKAIVLHAVGNRPEGVANLDP